MGGGSRQDDVKASDLLVSALETEGVRVVFGLPGEENLDVVESLRKSGRVRLMLTRHEQAAAFMAATYGRLTGDAGVALATLGPGATNLTTSTAFAMLGGMPTVLITGQKGIQDTKQGQFQILNIVEMMRPLTKYAHQITHPNILASEVRKAFRIATTEKPGPVLLELPEDVASQFTSKRVFEPFTPRRPIPDEKGVLAAVKLVLAAKKPLMMIGAAANRQRAVRALRQFVDELNVPFFCTQMGKGIIDERHPLFMGCAALTTKDFVHNAIDAADLIINVGQDGTEKPAYHMTADREGCRKVIHIGFAGAEVNNYYYPHVEVVGDIANAVWQIKVKVQEEGKSFEPEVFKCLKAYSDACLKQGMDDDRFPMNIPRVVADVREALPDEGRLSLDNGFYKVWFARLFEARGPNTVLLDNALATMGGGLPNGIGARIADPNNPVVVITGDGGWMMNCAELSTAVRYNIDMVVLILNDEAYGMIEWKQRNMNYEKWGLDLVNPDFVKHAESFGAKGYRVEAAEDLGKLLKQCINAKGVHVIDVPISYDWASQRLREVPAECAEIMRRAASEFGKDLICEDSLPSDDSSQKADSDDVSKQCGELLDWVHASYSPKSRETSKKFEEQPSSDNSKDQSDKDKTKGKEEQGKSDGEQQYPTRTKKIPSKDFSIKEGCNAPFYLGGKASSPNRSDRLEVQDKFTGKTYCTVSRANADEVEDAIRIAAGPGAAKMRALPHYKRKAILMNVANEARRRKEELAVMLAIEAGKAIGDSRGEVGRLIETFEIAAEEAVRIYGEFEELDMTERGEGFTSITKPFPIGPVSMISPFNFPLNLTAHKIAPAIAAGCSFVLKPASRTPLGALILGEILANDENMPKEGFSILPTTREAGDKLIEDDRFKLLTFTGSDTVGWDMKKRAGKKPVVLELGGNAACIVDDLTRGLDNVVDQVVHGGFYQSGQSCISVQRIFVKDDIYDDFRGKLVEKTKALKMGDPLDEDTFIGPVISPKDADRLSEWVDEAVKAGAKLLCGGETSKKVFLQPTVLENVGDHCHLYKDEAFGPVVCLEKYSKFSEAIDRVNNSRFGLQAGVFTSNIDKAHFAYDRIYAGGVVINAVPSVRLDAQAYGGVKDSGLGREGLRCAIKDMTELKVMLMKGCGDLANCDK